MRTVPEPPAPRQVPRCRRPRRRHPPPISPSHLSHGTYVSLAPIWGARAAAFAGTAKDRCEPTIHLPLLLRRSGGDAAIGLRPTRRVIHEPFDSGELCRLELPARLAT